MRNLQTVSQGDRVVTAPGAGGGGFLRGRLPAVVRPERRYIRVAHGGVFFLNASEGGTEMPQQACRDQTVGPVQLLLAPPPD